MKKRLRSPLLISVVAHLALGFVLIQLFAMPNPLRSWLEREHVDIQVERIGFISLPATSEVTTPGRRGGDDKPLTEKRPAKAAASPSATAPSATASTVTTIEKPGAVSAEVEGGTGPLVGGGGPLRGIQPSFHDPRLWTIPDRLVTAPRSSTERIDSVFSERFAKVVDSLSRVPTEGPTRDIPFMTSGGVLANGVQKPMLPFRPPPAKMDETRRLYVMRMELVQQSQRRLNEDEFRQAAQRIRERKDREREQAQSERQKQIAAPAGSSDR